MQFDPNGVDPAASATSDTRTIDLHGGYVLPGFVDTHIHLTSLALRKARCDLAGAQSAGEVQSLLADWAADRNRPNVMGVEWDETHWIDPTFPTRAMLDTVDSVRPVLARRICGHTGVANTVLLRLLTPRKDLIDSESGIVREHALWEAGDLCRPDLTILHSEIESAIRSLHRLGITAIHDIVDPAKFDDYLRGFRNSRAPLRVDVLLHVHPQELSPLVEMCADRDPGFFRVAGVKCFLDGSLGGRTAALNQPYAGGGDDCGMLLLDDPHLESIVRGCDVRGCVCAMHAIGDRAIDQALAAVAKVSESDAAFRIEHAEVIGDEQLESLGRQRAWLAMQPNFVRNWGPPGGRYAKRLGSDRARRCNPFRALKDAGVRFVFGSDGMPPGPLYGLAGATRHPDPGQRLDTADAIDRYTFLPNRMLGHARGAGDIARGQAADLVVLDANPLEIDLDAIRVTRTIVAGDTVFDSGDP